MAWTEVSETSNTWTPTNHILYVLADYWDDGYTIDTGIQWTDTTESSNIWVVIG